MRVLRLSLCDLSSEIMSLHEKHDLEKDKMYELDVYLRYLRAVTMNN